MKLFQLIVLEMLFCLPLCAQSYSDEVNMLQMDDHTVVLEATATGMKKKDAAELAMKSAFNALFHTGVEDVKNGVPMVAVPRKDYDYRFFSENRYISYLVGEVETVDSEKVAGLQRVTVRVNIRWKALRGDLQRNNMVLSPGWSDAKTNSATAALNPTIVVVPYVSAADGYSFESMRKKLEASNTYRFAIGRVAQEFSKHGYKTRDFISQLQNSATSGILRAGKQVDDATTLVQQLPGDIVVSVEVSVDRISDSSNNFIVSLKAVEKQTDGLLATTISQNALMYADTARVADLTIRNIQADFFTQLQSSFEAMIQKGREVYVEIGLSQAVADWDFEQDSPATGDYFKDALDDWLREHAFQGVSDMDNYTSKFIKIRINIPLWNQEKNRSYTLSNFGSELRKFLRSQLGDEYKVSTTAMGQRLDITIE